MSPPHPLSSSRTHHHLPAPSSSPYVRCVSAPVQPNSRLFIPSIDPRPDPRPVPYLKSLPRCAFNSPVLLPITSSMADFRYSGGAPDGPISPDAWKRAVYRRPPSSFHIKLLSPEKQGSSYSYGFRIFPIKSDDTSTTTLATSSGNSIASIDEYDVWRKWEDCLWFQDTLEVEYTRAAREKRNRLAAGKGVKKNGVYINSDQAASWESLPFGPDPSDIARDIHQYIPKLSKKGTLFRASQETVFQRYEDLQMMMQALLQDDLPTLIKDIKSTRTFTDFFGVWRRDLDLARKAESQKKSSAAQPQPNTRSTFPVSPFSLKTSSTKGKAPEKAHIPFRASTHSDSSSSEDSAAPPRPRRPEIRSRASSSESRSSSSSPSTPITIPPQLPPTSRQPIVASHDVPIRFGHNPHALHGERSPSVLESLPEDRELPSSPKSDTRRRSGSTASRMNRIARIYDPSPPNSPQPFELSSRSLSRNSRAPAQSRYSSATLRASAYLDELDVDYCLPGHAPEPRSQPRASVSSLASLVTNASVDAVIPRSERPSRSSANNASRPLSLPEEACRAHEPWSEGDFQSEDQDDVLDAYFCDLVGPHSPTSSDFPETPTMEEALYSSPSLTSSHFRYSDRRSSFATSISSGSTSSSGNGMTLSIKAMHEDNIVVLRPPRYITFDELRRKIYDKFVQTDKATICETFAVALVEQTSANRAGTACIKGGELHFISSQDEWEDVVAIRGGKLLLRIIGSRE